MDVAAAVVVHAPTFPAGATVPNPMVTPVRPRWFPHPLLIGTFLLVAALSLVRWARDGLQVYGSNAQTIEHTERLWLLEFVRGSQGRPLREILDGIDGSYPPLLHLLTLIPGAIVGHRIEDLSWWPGPWILLLGLGIAGVGRAWAEETGLEDRSQFAGALVGALGMAIPAVQGSATRYYYDLPMTAFLWAALALAARDRWAFAGLFWALAALTKWTALPFGAVMFTGLLLLPRRLKPVLLTGGAAAAVLSCWFLARGGMGSLIQMATTFLPQEEAVREGLTEPPLWEVAARGVDRLASVQWAHVGLRLRWHAVAGVTSVLSPALAAALLVLLILRRPPWRSVLFAVLLCGGQWLFLAWLIPVHDQRFMLTATPALLIPAALAVARGTKLRCEAALLLTLSFLVSIEAQFGPSGPWNRRWLALGSHPPSQMLLGRGPFLASSVDGRGWWRADDQPPNCEADRQRVWAAVLAARPSLLGTDDRGTLMGAKAGSNWLGHEAAASRILDGIPIRGARPRQAIPQGDVDLFVLPGALGAPGPAVERDPAQWQPMGRIVGTCGPVVLWNRKPPAGDGRGR